MYMEDQILNWGETQTETCNTGLGMPDILRSLVHVQLFSSRFSPDGGTFRGVKSLWASVMGSSVHKIIARHSIFPAAPSLVRKCWMSVFYNACWSPCVAKVCNKKILPGLCSDGTTAATSLLTTVAVPATFSPSIVCTQLSSLSYHGGNIGQSHSPSVDGWRHRYRCA